MNSPAYYGTKGKDNKRNINNPINMTISVITALPLPLCLTPNKLLGNIKTYISLLLLNNFVKIKFLPI